MEKLVFFLCLVLAVNSTPHSVQTCVPSNSCGPNGNIVGINVDYYCICQPQFVGQYCERMDGFFAKALQNVASKNKLVLNSDQYCSQVQTQCINGDPQLDNPQPICG